MRCSVGAAGDEEVGYLVTRVGGGLYMLTGDEKSGLEVWTDRLDMSLSFPVLPCWTWTQTGDGSEQGWSIKRGRMASPLF